MSTVNGVDAPTVDEDRLTGVWTVGLRGPVTVTDASRAGAALDKCLAACPAAIVVDLRRASFDATTLPLLPTWHRRAGTRGVALEYVTSGELARGISRDSTRHFPTAHRNVPQATAAAFVRPGRRWFRLNLVPGPMASVAARNAVTDLCLAWCLNPLLHRARLLVSELVDNAAAHAGTDMELTVGVYAHYLHIRLRDGHPGLPEPRPIDAPNPSAPLDLRGTGLPLLTQNAAAWGSTSHPDGKTVWATLRLPPQPSIRYG